MKATDKIRLILGAIIVMGFFATFTVLLLAGDMNDNVRVLLEILVGSLVAAFSLVVGFYFGSSQSSKDKTEIMKEMDVRKGAGT